MPVPNDVDVKLIDEFVNLPEYFEIMGDTAISQIMGELNSIVTDIHAKRKLITKVGTILLKYDIGEFTYPENIWNIIDKEFIFDDIFDGDTFVTEDEEERILDNIYYLIDIVTDVIRKRKLHLSDFLPDKKSRICYSIYRYTDYYVLLEKVNIFENQYVI